MFKFLKKFQGMGKEEKNKNTVQEKTKEKQPEAPYGTKISSITKKGIEFYWKKPEHAEGYEVFRSYQINQPFESIVVLNKRSIGTYVDNEFDYNKREVFYCVRSFITNEDGVKVFSEKTEPKKASYREKMEIERDHTYMYSASERSIRAFVGWGEVEDAEWSSSDENIASINSNGLISAKSAGVCTIKCTSQHYKQEVSAQVIVDRQACEPLSDAKGRYSYNAQSGHWENPKSTNSDNAVIMMVGDMMCGKAQMTKQYSEVEGWNFNDSYEFVKEVTSTSDFAIGNLETLLAAGWPYMIDECYIDNKNNCNATSRYLDAVRYGGFDAVAMSNNHNCDGGTRALIETIEQVDKYQFPRTGVFYNKNEDRFLVVDINGIKVGYLAYMSEKTGFNGKDADWTREEKEALLNIFSFDKAQKDILKCREAGAEYIIVYMHWGAKNFRTPTNNQIKEAMEIAEAGADYIVGANPHLIQKYDVIETGDGRKVPCMYSMGNFQSIMNQVTGQKDSVIMRICLRRNIDGKVILAENNYIPCYAYKGCENSRWSPVVVSEQFNIGIKKKNREKIHARIVRTVGDKIKEF